MQPPEFFSSPKIALITGSSRGIGKEIDALFRAVGLQVIAPLREDLDLSNMESVETFISQMYKEKINVDILVNTAGINDLQSTEEIDPKTLQKMFQVNLFSALRLIQAVLPNMQDKQWGRILNMSSILSLITKKRRAMYSMTKSALNALTQTVAVEYAQHGVLVNAICPGYVETELTFKNNTAADLEKIINRIPLRRMAAPNEIANFVLFLCSELNSYITGQSIVIDGGMICQ